MSFAPVLKLVPGAGVTLTPSNGQGIVEIAVTGGAPPSPDAFYLVNQAADAPVNAIDLSVLGTGVLEQNVTSGIASFYAVNFPVGAVPWGDGGGGISYDTHLNYDFTTQTLTTTGIISRFVTFGGNQMNIGTTTADGIAFIVNGASVGGFTPTGTPVFNHLAGPGLIVSTGGSGILGIDTTAPVLLATPDVNFPAGIDLGSLSPGLLQITVTGGVATVSTTSVTGGINQLTGDVTAGPGTGSQAATIAANAVTFAKMQTIADQRLIGNVSGSTAVPAALTAAQVSTFLGLGTLATQNGTFSGTSSGTNTGDQTITLTGDVTGSGTGSFTATIAKISSLTSAGFVKTTSGGILSVDTNTYLTTTSAASTYLTISTASSTYQPILTAGSGISIVGTTISATGSGGITALTGPVTASGTGSVATTITASAITTTTIASNAVTYAKIQTQADQTILGNVSGSTAVPSALTATQVATFLALTTTYQPLLSLTNKDVLFGTGAHTVGQDSTFQFDSSTHQLAASWIKSPLVYDDTAGITVKGNASGGNSLFGDQVGDVTVQANIGGAGGSYLILGATGGIHVGGLTGSGFVTINVGGALAVDTSTYLTTGAAASTYLTISTAASTYETQSHASSTYLTITTAASTYQPLLSLTSGGVVYATGAHTVATDTNNNVWDATNKRLVLRTGGAYTPAAGAPLTIQGPSGVAFSTIAMDINTGAQTITCSDSTLILDGHGGVNISGNGSVGLAIDTARNAALGNAGSLATTATDGFPFIPSCAGPPTGIPTGPYGTSAIPLIIDRTNKHLYAYIGGSWSIV